ncbi:hypothetical protein E1193_05045 [Micromonospora sp. KC606]|uniref:hypothetical protein n=1 Tax=Micromonospora sp. KC606 TaxID=2530379 RepID=UPI00104DF350|nr:hypothetical protein [Micromonospora sp. KC606]TDC84689.1 hypothetical protein E1193_05045 [Micromonospora sp. KC606]
MSRERLSLTAAIPDEVINPLLWRLALDVTAAHQPDRDGNCRNLQCVNYRGMCPAARTARHAINLAQQARPTATPPAPQGARGRAAVTTHRPARFRGGSRPLHPHSR